MRGRGILAKILAKIAKSEAFVGSAVGDGEFWECSLY